MFGEAFDLLDSSFSLLLSSLSEPGPNRLCIGVTAATLSEEATSDNTLGVPARKLHVTDKNLNFSISFSAYALYMIVNESHGLVEEDALFQGRRIRTYEKSNLLKASDSLAWLYDYGERSLRHYEVITENHLVSVLSYDAPEVTIVDSIPSPTISNGAVWYRAASSD